MARSRLWPFLRVDDTTVRRWIKQGVLEAVVLPYIHERQGYRINRETLEKLVGESLVQNFANAS